MKLTLMRLLIANPSDRERLLEALIRQLSGSVDDVGPDRSFPPHNPGKLKPGVSSRVHADGLSRRHCNVSPGEEVINCLPREQQRI